MSSSGIVDEDTARTINSGRETLGVMLRAAQKRLQKVFIFFVVGMIGGIMLMRAVVWPTLKHDLLARGADVIAQTPFDVILLQVKIGLLVGIVLVLPPLLYYAREPLRERGVLPQVPVARWKIALMVAFALVLFFGGIVYSYFLFFPIMFNFLANNALGAGFAPLYSVVHWTQFILVLGFSFGVAAELPLFMSALAYAGIVQYETFRDKWKYAVVLIFVFGALFSPPDVFTQLMWAVPLLGLYVFSLALTKVVVTTKRGSAHIAPGEVVRAKWNRLAGAAVVGFGVVYALFQAGGTTLLNDDVLARLPAAFRPAPVRSLGAIFGLPQELAVIVLGVAVALLAVVVLGGYYLYRSLDEAAQAYTPARSNAPATLDLDPLDAAGVRAAPPETFTAMTEEDALAAAQYAMGMDNPEKARAILDRFDESREGDDEAGDEPAERSRTAGDVVSDTASGMLGAFTEDEIDEDDIGGYYYDIAFILDSMRSRLFYLFVVFIAVVGTSFFSLYSGLMGYIRCDFLARLPEQVVAHGCGVVPSDPAIAPSPAVGGFASTPPGLYVNPTAVDVNIVTLHPVEALVFEVKLSVVLGLIATLPLLAFFAWPALKERGIVTGNRRTFFTWFTVIVVALVGGSALGYAYIAPAIISYLVYDAVSAGMVINYQVSNFFWLVFITTIGIGLFADIPALMFLFQRAGFVSYRTMRERWRVVVVGAFVVGGVLTPDSVYTMFIVAVPVSIAYAIGLALLWVATLGGRRDRPGPRPA